MNRISEDVSKVRMYYGPVLMYGTNAIVVLFVIIIFYMYSVAPKLTIYSLIPLPILSVFIYRISNLINKKYKSSRKSLRSFNIFSRKF